MVGHLPVAQPRREAGKGLSFCLTKKTVMKL